MTESRFRKMCAGKMAEEIPYCVEKCRGKKPKEIEFIELNREETVMAKQSGSCEQCGKKGVSNLVNSHGKKCCPGCAVLRSGVKNHIEMVRGMVAEFYGQETAGDNAAATAALDELHETRVILGGDEHDLVSGLAMKIKLRIESLDALYRDAQEEIRELHKQLATSPTLQTTTITGMAGAIAAACTQVRDFLLEKNESYGNSAADPVRIFSQADPLEQINVRIDDKLSRLIRGGSYPGDNDEQDLLGYLMLKQAVRLYHAEQARLAA